jgi:hypothetical protein
VGRLKQRVAEAGYVLLDVLVALLIVLIGFAGILGGMGATWTLAAQHNARVERMIEQRNADAKNHPVVFQKK